MDVESKGWGEGGDWAEKEPSLHAMSCRVWHAQACHLACVWLYVCFFVRL